MVEIMGGRLKQRAKDYNNRNFTKLYQWRTSNLFSLPTPPQNNNINKSFKDFIGFAD